MNNQRDVFICHASEDKKSVVESLVNEFDKEGITYWYDNSEIEWGDSLTQKVNEGLKISSYVIVVLSKHFINKNWPNRELNAVLNMEASSGEVRILPLVVGDKNEREDILIEFPLLNDKLYLTWDINRIDKIINALKKRLNKTNKTNKTDYNFIKNEDIHIPKVNKKYSQKEKDQYIKDAYNEVKNYFSIALEKFENSYSQIETDFTEVNNYKFISKIYKEGNLSEQCKIWLDNKLGSSSILYSKGKIDFGNDNSFNASLQVDSNEDGIGLKITIGAHFGSDYSQNELLNSREAAKFLWSQFTKIY
ncbi:MAG: TIR domain-containing protein [Candidatus Woesearchaeota archaeon]